MKSTRFIPTSGGRFYIAHATDDEVSMWCECEVKSMGMGYVFFNDEHEPY